MIFFSITKKIGSVIILSLFIFSIFGTLAYAQNTQPTMGPDCTKEYCALTTVPGAFDACKADKNGVITCEKGTIKNPVSVIKNIYGISIGIGAMLAIVMIIWAGIEYATTEAITGKSDAKEKWQGAVFGLVLLLASYIILRTINVDLVNINLDLGTPKSGGEVDVNALSNIVKAANETAAAVQRAEKNAIEAQKTLTTVKDEQNNLKKALTTERDPKKIEDLQQKITANEKIITDQEKVVASAITDQKIMIAINNQQLLLVEQKKKIEDLQKLGGTLSKTTNEKYDISKDLRTQKQIIEARKVFASQYNTNTIQIRESNPNLVNSFNQKSVLQQQTFDNEIANSISCPKGIIVTAVSVICKN
ncbi:MAG: hypothetical protein Q7R72_02045 [bacterium]|nr:hypothetical protein [bacterium]